MNERQRQTIQNAALIWELGLLRFLYDKGVLTDTEYDGIRLIAKQQADQKSYV